jgi:5-methylcytosine-specific restriction endonuclease McrA
MGDLLSTRFDVDRTLEQAITALRRLPYAEYLRTAHWQRVRGLALEQAGHTCDLCGHSDRLEVHHRTYERLGFERQSDLIVLCHDCHRDHHRALVLRAIRASEQAPVTVTVDEALRRHRAASGE